MTIGCCFLLITHCVVKICGLGKTDLIARFMGPTWGPSGADRTQVVPVLVPWTLQSGRVTWTKFYVGMLGSKCRKQCIYLNSFIMYFSFHTVGKWLESQCIIKAWRWPWCLNQRSMMYALLNWYQSDWSICMKPVMKFIHEWFDPLWPSNAIWRHISGTTLV